MNSLTQYANLTKRFPRFELSYETVSHKKVSSSDSVGIAIALGRKCFIWYTYQEGSSKDTCYLIGLDKDKQIHSIEQRVCKNIPNRFCLGTIVYCTIYELSGTTESLFITDDIYYYCGTNLSNLCFGDRIGFLKEFVQKSNTPTISLPIMWYLKRDSEQSHIIPADNANKIGYTAHHIQYREISRVAPYINVAIPKRSCSVQPTIVSPMSSAKIAQKMTASSRPIAVHIDSSNSNKSYGETRIVNIIPNFDFSKPAYRYSAIFNVNADPQLDLYHLYAYGGHDVLVYCGLAGIQSYKTSVFMNQIFRRIRENDNLDLVEESEDEDDFENTDLNKYVNLEIMVPIECIFNQKHKKWIPVRLADKREKLIHIEKIVAENNHKHNATYSFIQQRTTPHSDGKRNTLSAIRFESEPGSGIHRTNPSLRNTSKDVYQKHRFHHRNGR